MSNVVWNVSGLDRTLPDGDAYPEGKVFAGGWTADYSENGASAHAYGSVGFGEADPASYTPYSQITKEQALEWIFAVLGPDQVINIQEGLYKQVQEQLNPTTANGKPWPDPQPTASTPSP